ncbi:MAG: hypothetical protein A3J48_04055 [Candidatus Doudnabacteria bacterium RIFCSPHIGHO2_02_FULL_46_11]|uniref:RNA polymerase subunit sigma-24 n=1 Tax=Candidatus Doudnabacteria bacterium RIFCSPHIGHO2_02_FULL_46_11 TaxID=1817832 RepID=A0A1F5P8S6_9BACT|nr:MAG: hypothetical protein A3J48_04055 [Candidatus Doudnabacteria bacterium RIFCSPHIGHO2_02_FULL_46_11]
MNAENQNGNAYELSDDLTLISEAKHNPEAFTGLYDKYLTNVYRYFVARVSHTQTAEDLTSQTFLQAFKAFERYEAKVNSFGPWLFTIAHNILVNNYRKVPTLPIAENFDIAGNDNPARDAELALARAKLTKMLNDLPERDREVVMLRNTDDLSFAQIGMVLNITEQAARTAHHRAVQKLIQMSSHKEGTTNVPTNQ